ncbi:heat shock protein transcriptional repressor HspR [Chloroflexota bacterium]
MDKENGAPCYVISIAARMLGVKTHTLRYYERIGLVEPSRTRGNVRLFSASDIERLRKAQSLMDDLGVNLAGIDVILRMTDRMAEMEEQMTRLEKEVKRLKGFGII